MRSCSVWAIRNAGQEAYEESLNAAGEALLVAFGPAVLVTSAGIFAGARRTPSMRIHTVLLHLFFGLPGMFALAAILAGFVQIDQWRWNWRYVLTASLVFPLRREMVLQDCSAWCDQRWYVAWRSRAWLPCLLSNSLSLPWALPHSTMRGEAAPIKPDSRLPGRTTSRYLQ